MDETPQNGLKHSYKLYSSKQSSQTTTCDMSQSSSDHDVGGEEVCGSENSAKGVLFADFGSTHQSGSSQTNCETTTDDRQSVQELKCTDNYKLPIPDIQVTIPQSSSSENIQQKAQTSVHVSPLEGIVITQKLDSQTALDSSHDTDILNQSVQSCEGVYEKLEINGCEGVSPDQNSKELHEVLCATLENDLECISGLEESVILVDTAESSTDGRERFSEISDLSQESNLESNSCWATTELVCDTGDQNCTSSESSDSVDDVRSIIPSTVKDVDTIVIEQCNVHDETCSTSNFCCVDGTSCSASNESCKHLLFKTLAASVVDEILEVASKHLLKSEIETKVAHARKGTANIEEKDKQNEKALIDPVSEHKVDVSEIAVLILGEVSDFDKSIDFHSSLDSVSDEITVNVSECEKMVEPSQSVNDYLTSHTEINESPILLVCNGSSVSSSYGTYLDNSTCNLSISENVSNATECGSDIHVICPGGDGDLNSEAKVSSSNDCSDDWNDLNKRVKEDDSSESEILVLNLGERSRDGNASSAVIETNFCKDNVELSWNDKDLSLEAKVESAKDVCVEDEVKSSTVPNGACLRECGFSHLEKLEEKIASSSEPYVLSATNLDDSGVFNLDDLEQHMKVEKTQNDLTPPLSCNTDLKCTKPELNSKESNALDYITICVSASDDIGGNTKLSVAKVEDSTKEKAVTSNTSFQEHAEEDPKCICDDKDFVTKQAQTVSNESVPVPLLEATEKEEPVAGKEECSVEREIAVGETTDEELITGKEENSVKEVIAVGLTTVKEELTIGKKENSVEEEIASAETSPSNSCPKNIEDSLKLICTQEEPKSDEVSLKDDIHASIPLLENVEDFAEVEQNSTVLFPGVTEVPLARQELPEANYTSDHSEENSHIALSTMPCQFIVPTVNICPSIMEETYDGITDDESEISHATSDSESESNVKSVKPVCDGVNTINYKPLLEEDSNDRSTLSLISELDEASLKEDNLDNEQLEDESASLIMDDAVDRADKIEKDILSSNSELVQRVRGQRIRHDKMKEMNEVTHKGEKLPEEDTANAEYAAKINDIREALKSNDSLERLRELARSKGGLVNDDMRKEAWPRLLGIELSSSSSSLPPINMEDLRAHHEYNQVVLDVNRSLRRFPSKISPEERVELQDQLTEIILRVLMRRKDLSYYQGYHDVAVTILLVAGKDAAFHILERISVAHLSDCMLPTMERTIYLLNYIYPLLQRINPNLAERMDRLEIGTIFCLPWFLTWYGYSLNRYADVVRVFDYFLASPPLTPLYLAAVVVGRRSAEVLAADSDHATVHSLLSRIPETLPLEDLLREATDLYRNYPPDDIEKEVHERCERLRKAQEEEEEERKRMRHRRMIQRRHSMPTIAARQMPGWFFIDRFLGLPISQGRRIIQVSATVMFGMIAWHLRNEVYRYF